MRHTHPHICAHTDMETHAHTCTLLTHICTHIHTHTHMVRKHTYTYIFVYTYTQAYSESLPEVGREFEAEYSASVITNTQDRVDWVEHHMSQLCPFLLDHWVDMYIIIHAHVHVH